MRRLISFVLASCAACSKGGAPEADAAAGSRTEGAASPATPSEPAPADDLAGNDPVQMSLHCSSATENSFVQDIEAAEGVTACVVFRGDGIRADFESFVLISERDGVFTVMEPVEKTADAPWHGGARLVQAGAEVRARVKVPGQPERELSTSRTDFDWKAHPSFAEVVKSLHLLLKLRFPPKTFDLAGTILDARNGGLSFQVVFASDAVFTGDVTRAAADSYCAEAGRKIDGREGWRALLGTAAEAPFARAGYAGGVLDFTGGFVADRSRFDLGIWDTSIAYTESGAHAYAAAIDASETPRFATTAWLGVGPDAIVDAKGTCDDWSSADPSRRGLVIPLYRSGDGNQRTLADARTQSCAEPARILCLGRSYAAKTTFGTVANTGRVVIATEGVYRGDVGMDQADAICAAEGAAVLPQHRFRAVLSTSAQSARERLPPVVGRVRSFHGTTLSDGTDPFWDGAWPSDVIYTRTGAAVQNSPVAGEPERFEVYAWTGTAAGGAADAKLGNCADWSSAGSGATGRVFLLDRVASRAAEPKAGFLVEASRPCSETARLLCLSDGPADWEN